MTRTNFYLSFLETSSDTPRHNNVYIVNLLLCKDINVKKEINGADHQEPQSINLHKVKNFIIFKSIYSHSLMSKLNLQLNSRIRNTVEEKKRLVSALKANVSEEAQNLYIWLGKMLTSQQGMSLENHFFFNRILCLCFYHFSKMEWSRYCCFQ